jgi:lambda family phage portal protein
MSSKRPKGKSKAKPKARGYQEQSMVGPQNSDWVMSVLGEDADVKQNIATLRTRSRDLWKGNPYFHKYREELWANVFGEHGIALRMKAKETEDRVVHAPDEKAAIEIYEKRRNKVLKWAATKTRRRLERMVMMRQNDRGQATIIAGQLDVFANRMIEDRWTEWKLAENCDVRGRRDYKVLQQLRLLSAARDGDVFIRHILDPKVNKFGYSTQMVNSEWCDHWLNAELDNGNVIRMGTEYEMTSWGLGKPVAFHFIKRQPRDWEFSGTLNGLFTYRASESHDRVEASEITQYARWLDIDSTRPAPWGCAVIPKSRHLDQYELAEVVAARVSACKMGWLYSDIIPEGGIPDQPDPTKLNRQSMNATPGGFQGLPYGVKFQEFNPNHPNQNFDLFRKGMLRSWCAGMPGANYNIIANDAEGVSYSTGRIFSLDDRELWKLLQRFDIDTAERPIFQNFLQMGLITGAIPLPLAKFAKFNKPHFSGRRWDWVDPLKDSVAIKEKLLLGITSRSRECDDVGADFDDILFELAEEEMMIEEFGLGALSLSTLAAVQQPEQPDDEETDEEEDETDPKAKERKTKPKKAKAA